MTRARQILVAAALGLSLSAAACGSGGNPAASPSPVRARATVGTPAAVTTGLFGTGCGRVPVSGTSSLAAMAAASVVAAAARNPRLSELVHAIRVAGLTRTLDS